jgi:predicted phosphodiesterase
MQQGLWRFVAVALLLSTGVASAGVDILKEAGPNPLTHLDFQNNPANFQFAIMGDRHGSNRPGIFEKAVDQVNLLCPEFVMCVGDLVTGDVADPALLTAQWEDFDGWARKLEAPFFYVPGNHDVPNGSMGETVWKERLGHPYYHFTYEDVLFLCLNTEEMGGGQISEAQAEYMRKALEEHPSVRWTMLFMHRPLWMHNANNGWEKVEAALGNRPYTVFAGHTHRYLMTERNSHDYVVMSTSGGGTDGKSTFSGELDHVLWVTMTESGPRIANLLLDGIKDKNLFTAEKAALSRPILGEKVVHSDVAPLAGKKVTQANVTLTLNNPSDLPMNARGMVYENGQLQAQPARIECTVPPQGEIKVPVILRAAHALPVRELQPVRTEWTLAYDLPKSGRYEIPMTHRIVLDVPQVCERAGKKAGKDTWNACIEPGQLSSTTEDWKGSGDASFRFQVTQDKTNLYLKVHVTDDVRMAKSDQQAFDVDSVQICLDARPEGKRTYGNGKSKEKQPYLVLDVFLSDKDKAGLVIDTRKDVFAPFKKATPSAQKGDQKSPASYSAQATPDGYTADIAFSNELLDTMAGQPWKSVRVNVAVTDSDSPSERGSVLWWRPEWNSPASAPATGVFTR